MRYSAYGQKISYSFRFSLFHTRKKIPKCQSNNVCVIIIIVKTMDCQTVTPPIHSSTVTVSVCVGRTGSLKHRTYAFPPNENRIYSARFVSACFAFERRTEPFAHRSVARMRTPVGHADGYTAFRVGESVTQSVSIPTPHTAAADVGFGRTVDDRTTLPAAGRTPLPHPRTNVSRTNSAPTRATVRTRCDVSHALIVCGNTLSKFAHKLYRK